MKKLLAFTAIAMLMNHTPLYAAYEYHFTSINLGENPKAINNLNQVVGAINNQAFFWENGKFTDLGMGANSISYDINDNGVILGVKENPLDSTLEQPFTWDKGNVTTYRRGGVIVEGFEINNNNQALVNVALRNFDANGFILEGGTTSEIKVTKSMTDYPYRFDPFTDVADMNINAEVVGRVYSTGGEPSEGFLWENGTYTSLGSFMPRAINDKSQILGLINGEKAFYDNGSFVDLGGSFIAGILNNSGQILGVGPNGYQIWENGLITDIIFDESANGWTIDRITDMNENGWIIGTATNDLTGDRHMYVMSPTSDVAPVPEADTFVLVGFGLLGFLAFHRKRLQPNITLV